MFKVPADPQHPTYDDVHTISFWRWLTSSSADRAEWRRRRNAATHTTSTARTLAAYERHAETRLEDTRQTRRDLKGHRRQAKARKQAMRAQARQDRQDRQARKPH